MGAVEVAVSVAVVAAEAVSVAVAAAIEVGSFGTIYVTSSSISPSLAA